MLGELKPGEEKHITKKDIYEYLVLNHNYLKATGVYYKLFGAITVKQVAFAIGRGDHTDHISLIGHAIKEMDIPYYYKHEIIRFERSSVKVFACEYSLGIHLPNKITYQQYKMVEDIIRQIRQFEQDYNIKIKTNPKFEETLEEAKRKLDDWVYVERDEKIVGTPINEQYLIDSIIRELNIENRKDVTGLMEVARIISKYYHDNFFKDIIIKLVPNAGQIAYLFGELFGIDRYLDEISFNINDFSYENVEKHLQLLLSEFEKKRETVIFDAMYKEALRDNEEFDRKKAEELYHYSEMYEQALKDNEEFDKQREEEYHQSLLSNEAKAHKGWREDVSDYTAYQNYKKSVAERLEYEKSKDEYNKTANLLRQLPFDNGDIEIEITSSEVGSLTHIK